MKMKSMVLLAVAVACGLVAMLGVQQLVSNGRASAQEEVLVRVLVAKTEISPGTPLDDENTEFHEIPESTMPEGAVTSVEQYVERAPRSRLYPMDVVTISKLGEKGEMRASQVIPAGMRVVTVAVNLTKTHSGLVKPGDYVDMQVTYQTRNGNAGLRTKSKTFMQNIEVFATDSIRTDEGREADEVKAKNISLLVTPNDANLLKLAEKAGELHLVLRGQGDDLATKVADVDLQMLEDIGGSTERQATTGEENEEEPNGNVHDFLGGVETNEPNVTAEVAEVAPVAPEPQNEIWLLEIRSGEETSTEEILIPIVAPEPSTTLELPIDGQDAEQPGIVAAASEGVVSALKRVLNGSRGDGVAADDTDETTVDAGPATEAIAPANDGPQFETDALLPLPASDESTLDGTLPRELLAP